MNQDQLGEFNVSFKDNRFTGILPAVLTPLMQMSDERARELFSVFDAIGYDLPAAA